MTEIRSALARPVVLVVEDEALIAVSLEEEISDAGFEIAGPFFTCAAARHWLESGMPAFAVLDAVLKDGTCHAIADTLREKGVPFVIYSGWQNGSETSHLKGARWIGKPAPFGVITAAIRRSVAKHTDPTRIEE